MTIFNPHGTLKLTVEENIILMEAQGPWNIEYIEFLHKEFGKIISKVDRNNYGVLFSPKGEAISVEEGLEYHLKFLRHAKTTAISLNLAHCTTSLLTESLFAKLYKAAGIEHAFFDNAFDARLWLEQKLQKPAVNPS